MNTAAKSIYRKNQKRVVYVMAEYGGELEEVLPMLF